MNDSKVPKLDPPSLVIWSNGRYVGCLYSNPSLLLSDQGKQLV